ncbi:butyrate kinase [Eubacteriales bacterium OttesenSCG-928-A19]|nr:butyrate kinase [Eubacteriales bacterium OttesenSCG-928-A19]
MPDTNTPKDSRILVINPGSTSTKVAVFCGETPEVETVIRHAHDAFEDARGILGQKEARTALVLDFLKANEIDPATLDCVVGRGGLVRPIESGTYAVNDKMIRDLQRGSAGTHASSLGGIIAAEVAGKYGLPAFVVDPVVVDEMEPVARLSGIPGVERRSVFHALNTKAVARVAAERLGVQYEDGRFVVAHMGGGISVGAHRYGRVIDVSDALGGEGPFSPERCGSVPVRAVIEMCFSGQYSQDEMLSMVNRQGGMLAYLGTNDFMAVERMIRGGDEFATLVMDSMAYQVSKEIGAMAAVLEGRLHAILLTGGLANSTRFCGAIKQRVDQIAPVLTLPGEEEMLALARGALRVLRGEERLMEYT